ncbi:helix-turn-helix domain-containing protein [Streptomyces sp. NBC_00878]|uniref:helix-turn-helix domain-containing protein n=1 Tax=Streptomyces sp. NBC_00878 TaxID=2975854 RepID=UPI0022592B92|nr:helix-turn-helix domain-containing protein [Streptomyces sp. NBC_00878]MCX4909514.1 helix-turn-helix domain containing protein [Streptomyces sp. NBC_00878]
MYDMDTRKRALALVGQGRSLNSVSKQTGISRAAIRSWQDRIEPLPRMTTPDPGPPADEAAYAYLLGLYLGDGCISPHMRGTGYYLRVACADAWPGLLQLCREAIAKVRPGIGVYVLQKQGCAMVTSYSPHWPSLFPQHGPGRKHERTIALEPWQQEMVDTHPWEFVRGLIHSDGCRITNWTTRVVAGEKKRYEYPRYFFTNLSADITRLYTDTLDKVGVDWKQSNSFNVSVARRASVALMDTHVGPKY